MPDFYHIPALILTMLLLPAFGYLYLRCRDSRTLLWFIGFFSSLVAMLCVYPGGWVSLTPGSRGWLSAFGQAAFLISSAVFLAALSPLKFRLGRFQIMYVVPYTLPLVLYSFVLYGVDRGVAPKGPAFLLFPGLGLISLCVCLFWAAKRQSVPEWFAILICAIMGVLAFAAFFELGPALALTFVQCFNLLMAAVLVVFVFRRLSPGVALTVLGFVAWSLPVLEVFPLISQNPVIGLNLIRVVVMGKVVAALGAIVLTLEDELRSNKAAQERERRARHELEAYTHLILARRRVEDFDSQAPDICELVVEHSRFAQAALLLHSAGRYRLAGSAGLNSATVKALSDLVARIPATGFLAPGSAPPAVGQSQTVKLDLDPWLWPGDDLKRLRFTAVLAVPMVNRGTIEGALLLAGIRPAEINPTSPAGEPLRTDDLLPIELLVARLQATRSQTMMFEKLIDSEKFSHLGQLAANVTQQLNNPLTVVLGYASLLEEAAALSSQDRKAVESILAEARHMRTTLESLSRISRPYGDQQAAVSVSELLSDMGELHRAEFLRHSIEFRLSIAPSLPRVLCSPQQLRQAVRHCLQFAMNAVESSAPPADEPKTIRLEAASEGSVVQILVGHSGTGFPNPERAFDPFTAAHTEGENTSLGLSLCATILRDNNGRALAVNLDPSGAAIILELRAA
jgi:signal transduction histidine kinase